MRIFCEQTDKDLLIPELGGGGGLVLLKGPVHGKETGISHFLGDLLHGFVTVEQIFCRREPDMLNGFVNAPARILLKYPGGIGGSDAKGRGHLGKPKLSLIHI